MKIGFVCGFLVFVLLVNGGLPHADDLPPNGSLKVAYRQLLEGKLSESIHHLVLWCGDGQCNLTTLTLNQCGSWDERKVFYPKVERTSTEERNLSVTELSSGVLAAEERHAETTFKYRFTYKPRTDPKLSKLTRLQGTRWFGDLTGFSGAVVKDSSIMKKVVSWELVPLKGRSPIIEATCKILLDGVPDPKEIIDR
jgi:hypothetical protein